MATISSGQITIIDLHDAPSLNAWISASQTTAQTYNNTTATYSPNFATAPQVLTLNLTKAGSNGSIIGGNVSDVKWIKKIGTTSTEITSKVTSEIEYKSGTAGSILTTKTNIPTNNNAIIWTVEGIWTDPATGLPVAFNASINLTLVQLAKASMVANIYTPAGEFFRNNTPSKLTINADLYKDGNISSGSKKFKWFMADSSVEVSQDTDAGVGWSKVTATSGAKGVFVNSGFDVETNGQGVLTVYPDAVTNGQTFMVVITDNAGGTAGTKMKQYQTLNDMDDPIMVVVESTAGNILKNGTGSTTLKARLYRNGDEIDETGTGYTYKWSKWQKNNLVPNFGGASNAFKTGKTLAVGSSDVDTTTTFKVEVS